MSVSEVGVFELFVGESVDQLPDHGPALVIASLDRVDAPTAAFDRPQGVPVQFAARLDDGKFEVGNALGRKARRREDEVVGCFPEAVGAEVLESGLLSLLAGRPLEVGFVHLVVDQARPFSSSSRSIRSLRLQPASRSVAGSNRLRSVPGGDASGFDTVLVTYS